MAEEGLFTRTVTDNEVFETMGIVKQKLIELKNKYLQDIVKFIEVKFDGNDVTVYIGSSEKILILRSSKPERCPQAEITDASYDELVGV